MTQPFEAAIAGFAPELPLAVGLSGGADSTALLLACARRWPGQVQAFHVHHGLQAAADDFLRQCESLCAALGVRLSTRHVDARAAPGESPEAAARHARYEAFQAMALDGQALPAIKSMALAQHADDQVETLLLALSRGAGVAGLAAMPMCWRRDGLTWHRPLLNVAGREVREWLCAQGAGWIEDPSNQDERYTRNRIRRRLLPVLDEVFPHFRDTFARSSRHAAEAAALLRELAQADLDAVGVPPAIRALQGLSPARQANVLRHWLRLHHGTTPSSAQLQALLAQIEACATRGHRIDLKVGRGFVRRSGPVLDWYNHGLF